MSYTEAEHMQRLHHLDTLERALRAQGMTGPIERIVAGPCCGHTVQAHGAQGCRGMHPEKCAQRCTTTDLQLLEYAVSQLPGQPARDPEWDPGLDGPVRYRDDDGRWAPALFAGWRWGSGGHTPIQGLTVGGVSAGVGVPAEGPCPWGACPDRAGLYARAQAMVGADLWATVGTPLQQALVDWCAQLHHQVHPTTQPVACCPAGAVSWPAVCPVHDGERCPVVDTSRRQCSQQADPVHQHSTAFGEWRP